MPNNQKLIEENRELRDKVAQLKQYLLSKTQEYHSHMLAMILASGGRIVVPPEIIESMDHDMQIKTSQSAVNGALIIEAIEREEKDVNSEPQDTVNGHPMASDSNDT